MINNKVSSNVVISDVHHIFRLKSYLNLKDQEAFTLLEVMVSLSILAIAMTILFGSQSQGLSIASEAQFNTIASLLANQKLAELECGILEVTDAEGDFKDHFPGYTWKTEVRSEPFEINSQWQDFSKVLRPIDLTILQGQGIQLYKIRYYAKIKEKR
jgi:general secretion pathway protein I